MQLPHASPEQALSYFQAKLAFTVGPAEVKRMLDDADAVAILDVRRPKDFAKGHVPGARNFPKESWTDAHALDQLDRNKVNIVYCYGPDCHLAANFCAELASRGFRVMEMDGGLEAWKKHELDVEKSAFKPTHPSQRISRKA